MKHALCVRCRCSLTILLVVLANLCLAQGVEIQSDNLLHLRITPKGQLEVFNSGNSVFVGEKAGEADDLSDNQNVMLGAEAGKATTSGSANSATGFQALISNTTGSYNTANGWRTLRHNTTGQTNTAVGYIALEKNTTGEGNSALGRNALSNNIDGNNNLGAGGFSLLNNATGNFNTAVGHAALYTNVAGHVNTAVGAYALNITTGSENTGVGQGALEQNTTGSGNSGLGYAAGPNAGNRLNTTALGTFATTTANNQVRIGNGVTSIGGPAAWSNTSDGRFKENVQENVPGLDFVLRLRPVTYHLNWELHDRFIGNDRKMLDPEHYQLLYSITHTGFIAQEVEAASDALGYDFSGIDKPSEENDPYALRYAEFTVPLVKAVQEQQEMIRALQEQAERQQALIDTLLAAIDAIHRPENTGTPGVSATP